MLHHIAPASLTDALRHMSDEGLAAVVESSDFETLVALRDLVARQIEALDIEATLLSIEAGEL